MSISIKDGGVAVGMTLANGRLDLHIKPSKIRFDDNQWHKIIVQRRVQEVIHKLFFNYFFLHLEFSICTGNYFVKINYFNNFRL